MATNILERIVTIVTTRCRKNFMKGRQETILEWNYVGKISIFLSLIFHTFNLKYTDFINSEQAKFKFLLNWYIKKKKTHFHNFSSLYTLFEESQSNSIAWKTSSTVITFFFFFYAHRKAMHDRKDFPRIPRYIYI